MFLKTRTLPEGIQHILFHFQIRGEITAGRSHRGVTEIIANDREIDTRLEKGHSATVAESVGRHASLPEIWQLSGCAPCILADHISGSVTSEWGAAGVAEDGLIGRDI